MTDIAYLNRRQDVTTDKIPHYINQPDSELLMLIMTKWESCSFNTDLEIYELEAGWLHSKVINEWENGLFVSV